MVKYISSIALWGGEVVDLEIEDWMNPVDDRVKATSSDNSILLAIKEVGIAYPAEIVGLTGLSRQTVFDRLCYLKAQGVIERVALGRSPDPDMAARLPRLFELGIKGAMLKRMSWYRVVKHEADKKK
jgi:predicted transcriptional regulator